MVMVRRRIRLAAAALTVAVVWATSACALPSDSPGPVDVKPLGPSSSSQSSAGETFATTAAVLDNVKAAQTVGAVPPAVATTLTNYDAIQLQREFDCAAVDNPSDAIRFGECAYGATTGEKLMVVYGDSHSDMWAATLIKVAAKAGWQLRVFAKHACPAPDLSFRNPETGTADPQCDEFHRSAPAAVKALKPDLVVVTSISDWRLADGTYPTAQRWQDGWASTLGALAAPGTRLAMLGDLPVWPDDGPRCLAAHLDDVQRCSAAVADAAPTRAPDERTAAMAAGALYVDTVPWICAERCEPVIGNTRVYSDDTHLTNSYAVYLAGALGEALAPALVP